MLQKNQPQKGRTTSRGHKSYDASETDSRDIVVYESNLDDFLAKVLGEDNKAEAQHNRSKSAKLTS